jgi:UDP-glucuronate 4-epimerase
MRILVTGAAGFIGSHSCQRLLGEGHDVVGVDNFDPFYARSAKEANLSQAKTSPRFEFVEADLAEEPAVAAVFERGPFDVVLHLAAKAGVRPSIQDPVGYYRANIMATLYLLLRMIRQKPLPKLVFASSSSVYGNAPQTPFSETDPVDHPISPYAATKKAGELLCHTYHHLYGMDVFCLRFFTVYGPRQRPDLAIHKFARLVLAGEPIEVFGEGGTSRDYTYIDDIVQGVVRSVQHCQGYEIINLGGDHPVTLREMVDTVAAACGRKPVIKSLPMQMGDVERTYADIGKARRLLGYEPSTDFAQGVKSFVEWLRKQ